jgi:transcription termination factor Rho
VSAETLERSVLEAKDREQLMAIAQALGVKSVSRAKKADLIAKILEQTGVGGPSPAAADAGTSPTNGTPVASEANGAPGEGRSSAPVLAPDGEPPSAWEVDLHAPDAVPTDGPPENGIAPGTAVSANPATAPSAAASTSTRPDAPSTDDGDADGDGEHDDEAAGDGDAESEGSRRRRRRRGRNRENELATVPGSGVGDQQNRFQDRPRDDRPRTDQRDERPRNDQRDDRPRNDQRDDERGASSEPITVSGYLDLRDEGYGFLRVNGYLASRDDAYVSVKQTRQHGLRKGDHVVGTMRPAGRNEKNAALLEILTVNGSDPDATRQRPRFEDLTPLFPDERLALSSPNDPTNMTARIIDLIAPIGKGQRGLIVSPPKAGKTTIMKTIATAIERNNPEVKLIVLLIDERPEEVTDMRRTVQGEVIASTFDRPSEEHTHLAELAIERAKRMVEAGSDVVIILDGITRLSRAYNLAAPPTGRIMSGGIDAGALYPPKKFFGAARNIEEGGSLTILATALVETNSRMDDAIFEEFKGTGNMELRLDRKLAERRIFPAIDVDASSTRHEELLFDRKQLQLVWKLRRVLSGLAADGNAAPGLELLIDRLKTFRTNDEFLSEISKQPSM